MSKPLVSVIITNYNYGKYIPKAINSVLKQTYPNIELIIINDGSTDDSDKVIKDVIAKNPDRNIRYINRENRGVVYTRNEGLEVARGKYLCYLDADDYFGRDYVNKNYEVARDYGVDVVYPNWHYVGEWLGRPDTNFPEFSPELLQLQKLHCTPASLIRKEAVGDRRFEVEKVAEDWDFFIGLSLDGAEFKLAKDNYLNYRIRQGTRGSKNDPREDTVCFVEILQKYKNVYGDKVIDPQRLVKLRHPSLWMRLLSTRYPRTIIESVKKDGIQATGNKIIRRVVAHTPLVWKTLRYVKNKKYQQSVQLLDINKSSGTKLAVMVHLYYPDLWPVIRERLLNIGVPFDLFVSVQLKDKDIVLEKAGKMHKTTNIIAFPNRGRDVLPFLLLAEQVNKAGQYEYLLKLHSKKSLHRGDGSAWLESLLKQLIPSDTSKIVTVLEKSDTGAIGPADHIVSLSRYMGGNGSRIWTLIAHITGEEKKIKKILESPDKYPFFGGTMFWCRVDFITPLLDSGLTPADFNAEGGQVDATTAHAVERVLGRILHVIIDRKMYAVDKGTVKYLADCSYTAKYEHGPSDG